ncbi:MAG: hypothetical protein HZB62_10705 [Nitrospirae bacterium]|nr:hypothetical protein [Nitrospirota bacterium]
MKKLFSVVMMVMVLVLGGWGAAFAADVPASGLSDLGGKLTKAVDGSGVDIAGGKLHGYITAGKLWDIDYSFTPSANDTIDKFSATSPRSQFLVGGGLKYKYGSVEAFTDYLALTNKDSISGDLTIGKSLFNIGADIDIWKNVGVRVQYFDFITRTAAGKEHDPRAYTGLIVKF